MPYTTPKNWVADDILTAAELNEQLRSNLVAGFPTETAWSAFASPTLTNLTKGNGTELSRYIQIGQLCIFRYELTFGSTSSMGTSPQVGLPVQAAADYVSLRGNIGGVQMNDSGSQLYHGYCRIVDANNMGLVAMSAASATLKDANITATVPMTWTTNDWIAALAIYEVA